MGFDKNRFVGESDKDLDEFTCGICRGIFVNPVTTHCCQQTYCFDCIRQWLNQHNTCPLDRKRLTIHNLSRSPRIVTNILSNMKINCEYQSKGCQKVFPMSHLSTHLSECSYKPNSKCKTCGFIRESVRDHNCIAVLVANNKLMDSENDSLRKCNLYLMAENVKVTKKIDKNEYTNQKS